MKTFPSLTVALIAICVAIAAMMQFGSEAEILQSLSIASPDSIGLEQIKAGELWRLLTPAFIHFGPVHLLFNMIWLWDLGRMIEAKRGSFFLGGFVVVIGIASNLAQYFAAGPTFGGMSGVIYGMLAYVFMQMRTDANSGYVLHKFDVITSVGWFFLCWIGALGSIANWAHSAGLVGGLAWIRPGAADWRDCRISSRWELRSARSCWCWRSCRCATGKWRAAALIESV
jgi:membrane associated rhomboid family serine protease